MKDITDTGIGSTSRLRQAERCQHFTRRDQRQVSLLLLLRTKQCDALEPDWLQHHITVQINDTAQMQSQTSITGVWTVDMIYHTGITPVVPGAKPQ